VESDLSQYADRPSTERNGRKTLTTVQGIPPKFDHKKILKVIKKEFGMLLPIHSS
jgi:translation initiation factor 1 (eIF-1/SUI1)